MQLISHARGCQCLPCLQLRSVTSTKGGMQMHGHARGCQCRECWTLAAATGSGAAASNPAEKTAGGGGPARAEDRGGFPPKNTVGKKWI